MSKPSKYLRRLSEPVYLPLDADKVDSEYPFETDKHPHLKVRPLSYGEMMTLNSVSPEDMPAEVAGFVVGRGGDWGDCALPEPGDDLELWLRKQIPGVVLSEVVRDIVELNTLSEAAGNS